MSQRTIVRVERLSLPLSIGVLDHEREAPQTVVISIDMTVDIPARPSEVCARGGNEAGHIPAGGRRWCRY